MLHYKYVSNKLKNSTIDMYFRVFEDEDIFVSQMFEKSNGMNENFCRLYINHKDGKYETGTYSIPTRPLDKLLFDGLNTNTDKIPKLIYRNNSDSIESFNSGRIKGTSIKFTTELNPGASVMKKDSEYTERYMVFKKNVLMDEYKLDVVQSKRNPNMMNMIDYDLGYITLFNIGESIHDSDISDGKFKLIEDTECFEVYPNHFRIIGLGNFQYDCDKYGVQKVYKNIIDSEDNLIGLKNYFYSHHICDKINRSINEWENDPVIRIRIRNVCYHPALITQHGIMYRGKEQGYIETLEMTVIGGKIAEIEQVFEEISEKDFLIELEKEKNTQWKPKN